MIVPSERRDLRITSKLKLTLQKGLPLPGFLSATVPRMIHQADALKINLPK